MDNTLRLRQVNVRRPEQGVGLHILIKKGETIRLLSPLGQHKKGAITIMLRHKLRVGLARTMK